MLTALLPVFLGANHNTRRDESFGRLTAILRPEYRADVGLAENLEPLIKQHIVLFPPFWSPFHT